VKHKALLLFWLVFCSFVGELNTTAMPVLTNKKVNTKPSTKKSSKKTKKEVILNEEGKDISRYITKGNPKDLKKYIGIFQGKGGKILVVNE
jgi:hypothetical protein